MSWQVMEGATAKVRTYQLDAEGVGRETIPLNWELRCMFIGQSDSQQLDAAVNHVTICGVAGNNLVASADEADRFLPSGVCLPNKGDESFWPAVILRLSNPNETFCVYSAPLSIVLGAVMRSRELRTSRIVGSLT